jgi:hypothetical protein
MPFRVKMLPAMLALLALTHLGSLAFCEELAPNLKVFLCTGDFGMWAQDRVPMITNAVEKASPAAHIAWESHQSYNMTRLLESPAFVKRFDAIIIADAGIGQLTPAAQRSLVSFVQAGGGLVWGLVAKGTLPFQDSPEVVPMPLVDILPIAYPDFGKAHPEAFVHPGTDRMFQGINWEALTDKGARGALGRLALERKVGKGLVLGLAGGFTKPVKYIRYATFETPPGGWDQFPGLGAMWCRVLHRVGANSPVRSLSRADVDARYPAKPLEAKLAVGATRQVDDIRAAAFSIVALQQLYNEDGGQGEDLFLALNPRDWFDRRSQEVMPNTKGTKSDKPAFFKEFNIRGIYMGENSYGSYGQWDDAKYEEQVAKAIAASKKWPDQIVFFQAGNEPPLDAKYVAFHQRFVGGVLAGAAGYQVVGPNKAFNLLGVNPAEMQLYIDKCGKTTDVLNWHTYAQPPSTVLAEARYWSDRADGKMRKPGPAKVMFTESDAWNTGDSQFNYLMERALTFLPEPRIIANFQYCMKKRSEGGTYCFGVLQPEGEFSANYNGYWVWRNLRGRMLEARLDALDGQDSLRAISSISRDGKTLTTIVYFGAPVWMEKARYETAKIDVDVALPPGQWTLSRSDVTWKDRKESEVGVMSGHGQVRLLLSPYHAVALTWTRK